MVPHYPNEWGRHRKKTACYDKAPCSTTGLYVETVYDGGGILNGNPRIPAEMAA
jgi:hypothetical protein